MRLAGAILLQQLGILNNLAGYFKSNLADIGGDIRLLSLSPQNCLVVHVFFVLRYLSSNFKNEMMIPTDSSEFKCHHHCHHHHLHNYNNHLNHHNFHHNHHNHHYHYDYHNNNNGNNNRVIIMIIIIIIIIIILSSCLM